MAKLKKKAKTFTAVESFSDEVEGQKYRCLKGVRYTVKSTKKQLWDLVDKWKDEGKVEVLNEPKEKTDEEISEVS